LQSLSTQVAIPGRDFVSGRQFEAYKNSGWDYCVVYSQTISIPAIKSLVDEAEKCPTDPKLILLLPKHDTTLLEEALGETAERVQIILLKTPSIPAAAELINSYLIFEGQISPPDPDWGFVGASESVYKLHREVKSLAGWDQDPVLILGETGTGKELVAKRLHELSGRGEGGFHPYNLAALPPDLVENILYGHVRGVYTGAISETKGLILEAGKGTLFLDEIGETHPALQAKLLRTLQERKVSKIGRELRQEDVEARFVFATNRDLKELKEACRRGEFREDFLQRIDVLQIKVPSLSERKEDIPLLVKHFVDEFKRDYSRVNKGHEAKRHDYADNSKVKDIRLGNLFKLDVLFDYEWPGNVRELRSAVRRAIALTRAGAIDRQLAEVVAEKQKVCEAERKDVEVSEMQERPLLVNERAQALASFVESLLEENLNTAESRFRQLYEQDMFLKTRGDNTQMEWHSGRAKQNITEMKGKQNRSQFKEIDLREADHLATRLKEGTDPVSVYIRERHRRRVKEAADQRDGSHPPGTLVKTLVDLLNALRGDEGLPLVFQRAELSEEAKGLIKAHGELTDLLLLNRMLIEDAYPEAIVKDQAIREEVRNHLNIPNPSSDNQAP